MVEEIGRILTGRNIRRFLEAYEKQNAEGKEFRDQMMDYVDSGRKYGEESRDSLNLNLNLK